ncbi:unnamed protein product [Bursaphelenchus xylophilus]|uniref:(pine wood nematode) hypothetical protein n=1 Tax=Bursaphelenchus xylophilus TaxID=6326 RepID=A0A7I8XQL3_BURXY|nr:unnamed protein product [Bursaphelenchus xylophilus]CAG9087354.1 unnamed protein product [Bursaphelenchus xylophilus]
MFATKRAATRLEREAIGSSDVERFISQMRALCAVRCMYNVDWSEGASPDFNKTPCAVEFDVNGKQNRSRDCHGSVAGCWLRLWAAPSRVPEILAPAPEPKVGVRLLSIQKTGRIGRTKIEDAALTALEAEDQTSGFWELTHQRDPGY